MYVGRASEIIDMTNFENFYQDLIDFLAEYISITIFSVDDPLEINLPDNTVLPDSTLVPVKLPIEFLGIKVDDKEMIMVGDIGN